MGFRLFASGGITQIVSDRSTLLWHHQNCKWLRPFLSAAHTDNANSAAAASSWHQQWK